MEDKGFSACMGPRLRAFVEEQLVSDLNQYLHRQRKFQRSDVLFDWSESCIEGHRTHWLDGEIENFSGIKVLDTDYGLIAEGWMEFIETEDNLEVFWWFLAGSDHHGLQGKSTNTMPSHVWDRLSPQMRSSWSVYAPNKRIP
ncbi:MAG: hypothetical protein ACE369_09360 [Roseovarius sp.]